MSLKIEVPVDELNTGDIITIKPYEGIITKENETIGQFSLVPNTLPDEMRAGGRIPLIIGKALTTNVFKNIR